MRAWTNHTDTIIAEDLADVRRVLVEQYGDEDEATEMMNEGWVPIPDARPITITNADSLGPDGRSAPQKLTRTAAEWVAAEGRGLLCSTEY